jgi:hypothetical protein
MYGYRSAEEIGEYFERSGKALRHTWPRCQPYEASSGVKLQFTSDDFGYSFLRRFRGFFMGDLAVHSIIIANKPPDTQCCS